MIPKESRSPFTPKKETEKIFSDCKVQPDFLVHPLPFPGDFRTPG